MYATIIPFKNSFDDIGLTYSIPEELQASIKIGQIVEIPFKNKTDLGLVYSIESDIPKHFDANKIKEIKNINNENIFISWYRLPLIKFISEYYYSLIHNSLNLFLPINLKEKLRKQKLEFDDTREYKYEYKTPKKLTKKQEETYKQIINSKNNKILLFGVTWSWKTEIYIQLIKKTLEEWKQSLFLIPEIILANQILERIQKVFWDDVIIINSTVAEAKKTKYFLDIMHNKAKIILWTRSALFYPYNNLWLIIMDEEHDNSYISDSSPRYSVLELTDKIAELNPNIKLIKASWTPDINSMYYWLKGKYEVIHLLEKYKEA